MLDDGFNDLEHSYFYPGTHDNETIKGWSDSLNEEALNKIKKIVDEKLPLNLAIIKFCLHSNASDVIVPVWDLLEVDNEQRFNIPGEVNDTNWTYRVSNMSLVEKAFKLFNKLKSED